MTPHFPDLHGLWRHHALRPARGRRDGALVARAFRQPRLAQPRLGLGGRRGGGAGAWPGGGAGRRRPARDRLDQRRHRVDQPGAEGRGALLPVARQAHRHAEDRAQGGAGHGARAGAPGLRGHLPGRAGGRPARPEPAGAVAAQGHHPGVGAAGQQRDRRHPGHRRHRQDVPRARHHLPRRRGAGHRQGGHRPERSCRST